MDKVYYLQHVLQTAGASTAWLCGDFARRAFSWDCVLEMSKRLSGRCMTLLNMIRSRRARFVIFCTLSFGYIQGGLSCRLDHIHVYMRLATVVIHPFAHVCAFQIHNLVNDIASIKHSFAFLGHAWRSHLLFLTLEGMCVYLKTNHRPRVFCGRRACRLLAL